jgi:DNA-directed RNA polymerase subunit RPC12/RpoP
MNDFTNCLDCSERFSITASEMREGSVMCPQCGSDQSE